MEPRVWSKRDSNIPQDAVYVGRPSKWGNPFELGKDGTRAEVIDKYRDWVISTGLWRDIIPELQGKHLVCWCAPLACHADVLLAMANNGVVIEPRKEWPVGKFYAGIGSRGTPPSIEELMTRLAVRLNELGWTLRSGGAKGADTAFEQGAGNAKEIYLPWPGFNHSKSPLVIDDPEYTEIARLHHPNWDACSPVARQFHSRNVAQILGEPGSETYSSMVICWTPEGKGGGGTGQAIRIAKSYGIPVFDLYFGTGPLGEFMKGQ